MAAAVHIPVSEYLRTTYRPDRDYVDGELKERNVGEQPHAHIQAIITGIFREHRSDWGVRALPEQRFQITPTRFRIPDVTVLRNTDPKDAIISFAPLLCVEILSKDDTLGELQERVDDYATMGVENIWAIDPWKRAAYYASRQGFARTDDGMLRIEHSPITISLAEVFAELDEF
ncbi:Endonuclease, Uma2 family (restriction endonuclease fold) [Bryocella elongata]|uniref:Endonuclease, Uma2 family (Restriction endonuclease fold) n=1 Tax=Bryocella elongata TaxID=863522 RepID=A0A1H5Y8X6_9BACT|nr:Uma2 family endonuclease [Bryocella elongata]SEG20107.1 Endonuclease, Uma2 family (restriction endonuclease fold) [Bryocella elongata]